MDLEHKAIARLQEAAKLSKFYYQKPLLLAYSGGKDSEVCLELCRRAGVPFEVIHNHTTADAPETVYHVRKVFRRMELEGVKCEILHPLYKGQPTSMWSLIVKEMYPPIRKVRYCCRYLKEGTTSRRCAVLGVRRDESSKRAASGVAETFSSRKQDRKTFVTLYAHLSTVSVSYGQQVEKGQQLGRMGNTGNSYGNHLHFEVRNKNDTCIDPAPYIAADLPGLVTKIEKEDADMTEDRVREIVRGEMARLNPIYNSIRDVPDFWREDIAQLVESGIIKGTGDGKMGLTKSEVKATVIVKRAMEKA